jgi:hypothetical protein
MLLSCHSHSFPLHDDTVYAFFAPEIGKLFFPKGDATLRAVQTFSVFGAG